MVKENPMDKQQVITLTPKQPGTPVPPPPRRDFTAEVTQCVRELIEMSKKQ